MNHKISIVIPTRNRASELNHCISSLIAQSIKPDEIIVVDNSSTDTTKALTTYFKKVSQVKIKYVQEKNIGYPFVYNRGIREARYPWVAFIDDDCFVQHDWLLKSKLSILKNRTKNIHVFLGKSKTYYHNNYFSLATNFFHSFWKKQYIYKKNITNPEILDAKNIIYDKNFLQKNSIKSNELRTKNFFGAAQDCEIGEKIFQNGGNAYYNDKALVFHKDPRTLNAYISALIKSSYAYNLWKKCDSTSTRDYLKQNRSFKKELWYYCKNNNLDPIHTGLLFTLSYLTVVCTLFLDFFIPLIIKLKK